MTIFTPSSKCVSEIIHLILIHVCELLTPVMHHVYFIIVITSHCTPETLATCVCVLCRLISHWAVCVMFAKICIHIKCIYVNDFAFFIESGTVCDESNCNKIWNINEFVVKKPQLLLATPDFIEKLTFDLQQLLEGTHNEGVGG